MPKTEHLGLRLTKEEMEVVCRIKDAQNFKFLSDAVRSLIQFANVYFDDRVTIFDGVKPAALEMLISSERYRLITPLHEIMKSVPQLEVLLANYEE